MIRAILFDLDHTLYDPEQYYRGAFHDLAEYLAARHERDSAALAAALLVLWRERTSAHPRLFDEFLAAESLPVDEVPPLVDLFHAHEPTLTFFPDAERLIARLHRRVPLGIITDGHPRMQRSKVRALQLERWFDPIICTGEHDPSWHKPGVGAFRHACQALDLAFEEVAYVGDDPRRDALGAAELGMPCFRIRRGEYRDLHCPDERCFTDTIDSLEELLDRMALPAGASLESPDTSDGAVR